MSLTRFPRMIRPQRLLRAVTQTPDTVPLAQRSPMTAAQQNLAARYLPMALSIAKPLKKAFPKLEADFNSAAQFALCEAAQSFDPLRNVKFGTFARYRIWGALRDVARLDIAKGYRWKKKAAFPKINYLCENNYSYYWDGYDTDIALLTNVDPEDSVEYGFEVRDFAETALANLPPRHQAIMRAIYVDGISHRKAALRFDLSNSRVSGIVNESIDLIQSSDAYKNASASDPTSLRKPKKDLL